MSNKIKDARRIIRNAFMYDPDFKRAYRDNISMIMYDEFHDRKYKPKLRKEDRDAVSERLLDMLFG